MTIKEEAMQIRDALLRSMPEATLNACEGDQTLAIITCMQSMSKEAIENLLESPVTDNEQRKVIVSQYLLGESPADIASKEHLSLFSVLWILREEGFACDNSLTLDRISSTAVTMRFAKDPDDGLSTVPIINREIEERRVLGLSMPIKSFNKDQVLEMYDVNRLWRQGKTLREVASETYLFLGRVVKALSDLGYPVLLTDIENADEVSLLMVSDRMWKLIANAMHADIETADLASESADDSTKLRRMFFHQGFVLKDGNSTLMMAAVFNIFKLGYDIYQIHNILRLPMNVVYQLLGECGFPVESEFAQDITLRDLKYMSEQLADNGPSRDTASIIWKAGIKVGIKDLVTVYRGMKDGKLLALNIDLDKLSETYNTVEVIRVLSDFYVRKIISADTSTGITDMLGLDRNNLCFNRRIK